MVSGRSIVVAVKDQVSCDLAGEAVILHLKSGMYYGLNPVGAGVWSLIQVPMTVNDLCHALLQEYDVEPQRCERELLTLLDELAAQGLIEVAFGSERAANLISPTYYYLEKPLYRGSRERFEADMIAQLLDPPG